MNLRFARRTRAATDPSLTLGASRWADCGGWPVHYRVLGSGPTVLLLHGLGGSSRYWRKVVTATEGIVLTVAAAGILPDVVAYVALVGGVALLAESFGRDVVWLWRHRHGAPEVPMLVADRAAG